MWCGRVVLSYDTKADRYYLETSIPCVGATCSHRGAELKGALSRLSHSTILAGLGALGHFGGGPCLGRNERVMPVHVLDATTN